MKRVRRLSQRERLGRAVVDARKRITPALLTVAEAAVYLSVSVETLKFQIYRTRAIPSVSLAAPGQRGLRRLRREDLDELIRRGYQPAVAAPRRAVHLKRA